MITANYQRPFLKEIIDSELMPESDYGLNLVIGKLGNGKPLITDFARLKNLLVISETEEQKTLTIKSAITSLSYRKKPENLGLIIIDSTPSALNVFKNSQNLIHPIIKEKSEAIKILEWAKLEMDARIKQHRSKSATQDQSAIKPEHDKSGIPEYIIIVINELADLMVHNPSETELLIATLGQKTSRIGIHLIIATTHQNYDVLTGLILANYPSKIIFKPLSKFISRIIDQKPIDQDLENFDTIFIKRAQKPKPVNSPSISDQKIGLLIKYSTET